MKIMILGGSGLLGTALGVSASRRSDVSLFQHTRKGDEHSVDVTNVKAMRQLVEYVSPDAIINTIGLASVEQSEMDFRQACEANIGTALALNEVLSTYEGHLFHISTDQVYSGLGSSREDDEGPMNVYGISKLWGEKAFSGRYHIGPTTIFRTNFVTRDLEYNRGFVDRLILAAENGSSTSLWSDVLFNPVTPKYLLDICTHFFRLRLSGVYNVGASEVFTKYEFGNRLLNALGYGCGYVVPTKLADEQEKFLRPRDLSLAIGKLQVALGASYAPLSLDSIISECLQC